MNLNLIRQKLRSIEGYVDELEPYLEIPLEEYLKEAGRRRIVERLSQLLVECAIDTNNLLIVYSGKETPGTSRESFEIVKDIEVLDESLFERFNRTYIGFRNRLVHDYERLDNVIVYKTAKRLIEDMRKYVRCILDYTISIEQD